jgi:hypothetical protein
MVIAGDNVPNGFSSRTFHTPYTDVGTAMTQAFAQDPTMAELCEAQIKAIVEEWVSIAGLMRIH